MELHRTIPPDGLSGQRLEQYRCPWFPHRQFRWNSILPCSSIIPRLMPHLATSASLPRGGHHIRPVVTTYQRSTAIATALPPPRQRAAIPLRASRLTISCSSVTRIRAPLQPIGWPNATEP